MSETLLCSSIMNGIRDVEAVPFLFFFHPPSSLPSPSRYLPLFLPLTNLFALSPLTTTTLVVIHPHRTRIHQAWDVLILSIPHIYFSISTTITDTLYSPIQARASSTPSRAARTGTSRRTGPFSSVHTLRLVGTIGRGLQQSQPQRHA